MLARVSSAAIVGVAAVPVAVEVDVSDGLPGATIVGLPDATVRESKDRIRSAIRNTQFTWPLTRVTVNLAPADVRKEGAAFDLPIALGLLAASDQLDPERLDNAIFMGELALDGRLRTVPGALAVALSLRGTGKRLLLPSGSAREAAVVEGVDVYPAEHLHQVIAFLNGTETVQPLRVDPGSLFGQNTREEVDFSEIRGQAVARRAVEVAVAGGHNLLLLGPPGSGKSMLARRIPTIIPELTLQEALETTLVYSVLGMLTPSQPLVTNRPFRAPHHTVSEGGLIGGGTIPKPGELSLAHHGVLFLDELAEFGRATLETLRQPLEEGYVTIARVHGTLSFPARVMLVAAMNACPCGFSGDPTKTCLCSPSQVLRYRAKISGPLLDRIDMHLEMSAVPPAELTGESTGEPSSGLRARVRRARQRQRERFREEPSVHTNAQMRHRHLRGWCRVCPQGRELLRASMQTLGLSARGYDRLLKVARTIADLAESEEILPEHLAEAIQYRALDRHYLPTLMGSDPFGAKGV